MDTNSQISRTAKIREMHKKQRDYELHHLREALRFQMLLLLDTDNSKQNQQHLKRDAIFQKQLKKPVTMFALTEIINNCDVESLFDLAVNADYEEQDLLVSKSKQIMQMLNERLHMPLALLTLGNLLINFDTFTILVFESDVFEQLVERLAKQSQGSSIQIVLLWTLVSATERFKLADPNQVKRLLPIIQTIQKVSKQNDNQIQKSQKILIRLLKNISEVVPLNQQMIVWLTDQFWETKNSLNKLIIYCFCSNLLAGDKQEHISVRAFLHALTVCLKGRHLLILESGKADKDIENVLIIERNLLLNALKKFNKSWNFYEQFQGRIRVHGQEITTGVHNFFLLFFQETFMKALLDPQDIYFLKEFFIHAPLELTIGKWLEFGTIQNVVSALTGSPLVRKEALNLLEDIVYRIVQNSEYRNRLLTQLKVEGHVNEAVSEAINIFPDLRVGEYLDNFLCGHYISSII